MSKQKFFEGVTKVTIATLLALLGGCQTPSTVSQPTSTPIPSPSKNFDLPSLLAPSAPLISPSSTTTVTPPPSVMPSQTTNPTPVVSTTPSSNPISNQELVSFNGSVYDSNGNLVTDANVSAKSVDPFVNWVGQDQVSTNGEYSFKKVPTGIKIEISVTKDGWTKRIRTEILKSNLISDPKVNKYDFGGLNDPDKIYSIQDEPEITSLKINGKQATDSDTGSTLNPIPRVPDSLPGANVTGVSSDSLTVEMTFSEPVKQDDVQNYFRITSQNTFSNSTATRFTIDKNVDGSSFVWSTDGTSVTFTSTRGLLSNSSGDEAKYMIDFSQAFRDKTDKIAKAQKYFRFTQFTNSSPIKTNDFHVFSVANQNSDPILVSVSARDGGSGNDLIDLTFNKAMYVTQTIPQNVLGDPKAPTNVKRQLVFFNTNNDGYNKSIGQATNALKNTTGNITLANNISLLGYTTVDSSVSMKDFTPVYSIGRITSQDLNNPTILAPSNTLNLPKDVTAFISNSGIPDVLDDIVSLYPTQMNTTVSPAVSFKSYKTLKMSSLGCGTAGVGDINVSIKSVKVNGKVITLELDPKAFDKNDKVIVNVGGNINGKYDDRNYSTSRNELKAEINGFNSFVTVTDPSGKSISSGNSSTSGNMKISDSQKLSIAQ